MNPAEGHTSPHTAPAVSLGTTPGADTPPETQEKVSLSEGSREVWTQRMLEALARGNEGKKWHTLSDKVWSPKTLAAAVRSVTKRRGSGGIDGQSVQAFAERKEEEMAAIARHLRENRYEAKAVRRCWIEKMGSKEKRPLGIPTVRDRVVQSALLYVIEPIFEKGFHAHSYGFRPQRSAFEAIARVETLLGSGHTWVVDADIKGYFDSIPQEALLARIGEKIADSRVLELLRKFLRQGVMDSAKGWEPTESGTPQGAVISPLLANIYLDPLDQFLASEGLEMTRYADDFIIQCRSEAEAQAALWKVQRWMEEAGLQLHREKTKIVDATQYGGFDFLGWHFERGHRWPREKSQGRLKDSIRELTRRHNGSSMERIIEAVNQRLRGWGSYFRGGVRNVSVKLDQWARMRLRSILRQRAKRKGRGRGFDHNRYTNNYFRAAGLISLLEITHAGLPVSRKGNFPASTH